jgi:phosphoglycerate dehydrogenase-like enzyme
MSERLRLVVEDDPFPRMLRDFLDPAAPPERTAALADFFAHDLPDFTGWRERLRAAAGPLFPAEVVLAGSQEELRAALPGAAAVVTESLVVGPEELARADRLRAVQKYGTILRNIDTAACAAHGVRVLTLRRRANVACAEHALALMLALAKQLNRVAGLISEQQLRAAGYDPRPFDRRHVPNSNYGRVGGIAMLYGATLGVIGLGEIGRELAQRAHACGMRVLYHQRTRLAEAEERDWHVEYRPLDALLAESDWVAPQLPGGPATRGFLDADRLARMKRGARIVNVARASLVDRAALLDALHSGRLGGFALDPLYEEPGRDDDELLGFDNVILTPHTAAQPRFNALADFEELVGNLARAVKN